MHHGGFSRTHLTVVQTEYEVNRSIIGGCTPIQLSPPQNPVFCTLTLVPDTGLRQILRGSGFGTWDIGNILRF